MNYSLRQPVDKALSPIQTIFKNRGMDYSPEAIREYINPTANAI